LEQFLKCLMKILLGDFIAKVGREDFLKLEIGNENLRVIGNDNGVRVVKKSDCKEYNVPTSQRSEDFS